MPAVMPAMAPPAVARRQNSPPKNAGASCAMAANDKQADGGKLRLAGRAVIHVGEQQNGENRQPPHREQQRADILAAADAALSRRCSTSGMMRSFDTMIESATDSTITMAVAADSPPTKAAMVRMLEPALQRQRQHEHVAVDLAGRKGQQAGERDRHHEQVDQHQIERKQPGGALDLAFIVVFDHRHVELPRQQDDRHERQQRGGDQRVEGGSRAEQIAAVDGRCRPPRTARPGRRTSRTSRRCRPPGMRTA